MLVKGAKQGMTFFLRHKRKIVIAGGGLIVLAALAGVYINQRLNQPFMTAEKLAEIKSEVAAQNEAGLFAPQPQAGARASRKGRNGECVRVRAACLHVSPPPARWPRLPQGDHYLCHHDVIRGLLTGLLQAQVG